MLYGIWDGFPNHHPGGGLPGSKVFFGLGGQRHHAASSLKVPSPPGWAGRRPRGVKGAAKMAALFCTPEGSRGRLPFASGEAVRNPAALPGRALCPLRPDGASSLRVPHSPGR